MNIVERKNQMDGQIEEQKHSYAKCDHCGRVTSMEHSNCVYCGVQLWTNGLHISTNAAVSTVYVPCVKRIDRLADAASSAMT
jgi:rRNA maturation endonuclease Nob1